MTLFNRHILLLAALAACGPGSGDESPGTDSTSTGGNSMSSSPSDPSMSTLPPDPTIPDPTATTVQPTTLPPTTTPPDPTTTTSPTTPTVPTTVSTVTTEVTFSDTDFTFSDTQFTFSDTEFTTFDPSDVTFIVPSDVQPPECNIFGEDCPIGQKCMPFADNRFDTWNSVKCVTIAVNPAQPGDPCVVEGSGVSGIDNCDIHGLCFDVEPDTLEGHCVAMCTGDEDNPICPPGSSCSILNGGVLVLCLTTCDPLVVQSCQPGDVCVNSGDDFQCVFDASGEDGQQFDVCEFANDCDPGFVCVDSDGVPGCDPQEPSCCTTFCDLTQPNLCPPQTTCVPFFANDPPPGHEDVGVCFEP